MTDIIFERKVLAGISIVMILCYLIPYEKMGLASDKAANIRKVLVCAYASCIAIYLLLSWYVKKRGLTNC